MTIRDGGPGWGQDAQSDVQKHVCQLASGNGGATYSLGHISFQITGWGRQTCLTVKAIANPYSYTQMPRTQPPLKGACQPGISKVSITMTFTLNDQFWVFFIFALKDTQKCRQVNNFLIINIFQARVLSYRISTTAPVNKNRASDKGSGEGLAKP